MKITSLIETLMSMNPNADVLLDDEDEFMDFDIIKGDDHGDHALVIIRPKMEVEA